MRLSSRLRPAAAVVLALAVLVAAPAAGREDDEAIRLGLELGVSRVATQSFFDLNLDAVVRFHT